MIDRNSTRAFFQKRLIDNIASVPFVAAQIVWPNVPDTGVDKTALWVRVFYTSIGEEYQTFGDGGTVVLHDLCQIEIFRPIAGRSPGTKDALDAVTALMELFKIGTQGKADATTAVYIDTTRPHDVGQFDAAYHREAMQFIYRAYGPN